MAVIPAAVGINIFIGYLTVFLFKRLQAVKTLEDAHAYAVGAGLGSYLGIIITLHLFGK